MKSSASSNLNSAIALKKSCKSWTVSHIFTCTCICNVFQVSKWCYTVYLCHDWHHFKVNWCQLGCAFFVLSNLSHCWYNTFFSMGNIVYRLGVLNCIDYSGWFLVLGLFRVVLFVWFDSLRPINNLSVIKGRVFLGWTSTKLGLMCLAQGHNAVTPVRLEPAAPRSRVKHSTTEPLRSFV